MSKVTVFIADGTEEVECLTTVDILRRANIETQLVSITDSKTTVSSHGVTIVADNTFAKASYDDSDMLFIPGGMPGTTHMSEHEGLAELIKNFVSEGKKIAAVCAGPSVIGRLGLLDGKKATCFPGWEDKLIGATCTGEGVVTDGIFTTGRGLGFSIDLALEMVKILEGQELADDISGRIQHP